MSRQYTISGVKVAFPFTAYPCQMAMMAKILQGLKRGQHCLLESPTGSGKSLALLCAALAWQEAEIERIEEHNRNIELEADVEFDVPVRDPVAAAAVPLGLSPRPPASKAPGADPDPAGAVWADDDLSDFKTEQTRVRPTLKCVSAEEPQANGVLFAEERSPAPQVSKKRLKKPKIYFGTRTHKQIAQITQELRRTSYKHVKMTVLGSREHACIHPEVSLAPNKNDRCRELRDPNNLVYIHVLEASCGYYTRGQQRLRCQEQLKEEGLAEAWPLEELVELGRRTRVCPYYAARHLKDDADIVFCPYNYLIEPSIRESMEIELKHQVLILDEAHNIEDSAREAASISLQQAHIQEAIRDLEKAGSRPRQTGTECRDLARMLSHISQWADRHTEKLDQYCEFDRRCKVFTGTDMVAHFISMGIGPEHFPEIQRWYSQLMAEEMDNGEEAQQQDLQRLSSATTGLLGSLVRELGFIYGDNMRHRDDFRMALVRSMTRRTGPGNQGGWLSSKRRSNEPEWSLALNFWCLNPAVVFGTIGRLAHSVVVASGTLSPLSTFQSELGTQFPLQLEASHIIKPEQVYVATVSHGPQGGSLNATYRNSEQLSFQDELGETVLGVCAAVPNGVLCFFPSYSMLDKLVRRWRMTGLWDRLEARKPVLCEPRRAGEFEAVMRHFRRLVDADSTGALLLAVCRGKLSEGIDFSDDSARAVITVGIPYPNVKDVQVDLKRSYNSAHAASRGLLNGHEWYSIQAYRALNQALGRCIRHRYDWGAILLVDERFRRPRSTDSLSRWVRSMVRHPADWGACLKDLGKFAGDMRRWTEERKKQLRAERAEEASRLATAAVIDLTGAPTGQSVEVLSKATPPMSPGSSVGSPLAASVARLKQFRYASPLLGGSTDGKPRKVVLVPLASVGGGGRQPRQEIVTIDGARMLRLTDENGTKLIPLLTRDGAPAKASERSRQGDCGDSEEGGAAPAPRPAFPPPQEIVADDGSRLTDESGSRLVPVLGGESAAEGPGADAAVPEPAGAASPAPGEEPEAGEKMPPATTTGGKRPLLLSRESETRVPPTGGESQSPELVRKTVSPSRNRRSKQRSSKRHKGVVFSSDED